MFTDVYHIVVLMYTTVHISYIRVHCVLGIHVEVSTGVYHCAHISNIRVHCVFCIHVEVHCVLCVCVEVFKDLNPCAHL